MRFLLTLLAAMVSSLVLGLGSAWYMVAAPRTGTVEIGAWRGLPTVDAATADPYLRARVARNGEIGMGTGEGLTFVATVDDAGRGLVAECDYRIAGASPAARLWTLTATDADGATGLTPEGRAHLDSRNLLRDATGAFEVSLASTARAGNWLPAPPKGAVTVTLRLYDTPLALGSDALPHLPAIEREACR